MLQGHVAGKNFMRCSHEGACCGDRFLEVFTRRVLSQGHVVISFSFLNSGDMSRGQQDFS